MATSQIRTSGSFGAVGGRDVTRDRAGCGMRFIFGGWFYALLIKRGCGNNVARKLAMLACALMVLPIVLAPRVASPWLATGLISLAMAGHCGWAANIFTIVSDIFPRRAGSSVTGICGFGGA